MYRHPLPQKTIFKPSQTIKLYMVLRLLRSRKREFSRLRKSKFPSAKRRRHMPQKSKIMHEAVHPTSSLNMSLLENLISALGVSGNEEEVRDIIVKEIKPYVDDMHTDSLGNLIAHKKGARPKIMLAAHMDEVGLMLKRIDDRGIIYCSGIGGINIVTLLGQMVHIDTKKGIIHGAITSKEIWAGKEMKELPNIEEVLIDTGLSREELLKIGVTIGSYLPLEEKPFYLGSKDIICGKALDDRLGCFILIELARRLKHVKNEVYYVFTVQEEFGLYGAKTSAFEIEPDWGIAVDVTHANDVFDEPTRILGNGPVITIKDGELLASKKLNDKLIEAAKRKRIPYQLAVIELGTSDATNMLVTKGGIPATVFGPLIRNIHTTVSIAHRRDIENAVRILEEFLKGIG